MVARCLPHYTVDHLTVYSGRVITSFPLLVSQWKHAILPVGHPNNPHERENGCSARNAGLDGAEDSGDPRTAARLRHRSTYRADQRDLLTVNQGTLYPILLRLEQEGSVASEWRASENNRKARFYQLTRDGRKQLQAETRGWEQRVAIMGRFFAVKAHDLK
jgi:hypothetical protein